MRLTVLSLLCGVMLAGCQPSGQGSGATPTPEPVVQEEQAAAGRDAPPPKDAGAAASGATAAPCREQIGSPQAERLVQRCIMVSPATHPPCNVANPCAMIQGEIDRACAMYGPDETRPGECTA